MGNRIAHKGLSSFSPIDVNGGGRIPYVLTNPKIPKVGYILSRYPIASSQILSSYSHTFPLHLIKYGSVSKPCTPSVHIKIAGKWMLIPLKLLFIGIGP